MGDAAPSVLLNWGRSMSNDRYAYATNGDFPLRSPEDPRKTSTMAMVSTTAFQTGSSQRKTTRSYTFDIPVPRHRWRILFGGIVRRATNRIVCNDISKMQISSEWLGWFSTLWFCSNVCITKVTVARGLLHKTSPGCIARCNMNYLSGVREIHWNPCSTCVDIVPR